ncbi:MAG: hypothetical protein MJ252_19175, partial [archaeon]|nr:hypothetical protein [archaeon]
MIFSQETTEEIISLFLCSMAISILMSTKFQETYRLLKKILFVIFSIFSWLFPIGFCIARIFIS